MSADQRQPVDELQSVASPPTPLLPSFPPTWMVVHPRERRAKCTIRHLREQPGYVFYKYPKVPLPPAGYCRLGLGGPLLSPADAHSGLLILDGTWRWAEQMLPRFQDLPVRSLPPLVTAYPRVSKLMEDPDAGLATVEALFAAYRLLGRPTDGILDQYHWRDEFLALNGWSGLASSSTARSQASS